MANKALTMLQVRRILKLLMEECSQREIHRSTGIHRVTIKSYLHRFTSSGKPFSELYALSDYDLSVLVHPPRSTKTSDERYADLQPQLQRFSDELNKTNSHVTKQVLWEEYLQDRPTGYQYSQFCYHVDQYIKQHAVTMPQQHEPGYRLQIDFAGDPLWIIDPLTRERIKCPVLVCTLPCSSFFYVEPLSSCRQEHLIPALNRALAYFGGVPKNILSDNMKQVVTTASRYEPVFNDLMEQWALHYQTNMQATRAVRPKDKPSVEGSVHHAYQQIYARLRNEEFTSLSALTYRVRHLLDTANDRLMTDYGKSRRQRFMELEQEFLQPLPLTDFVYKRETTAKVKKNYHVILGEDRCQYSVPHEHIGKIVKLIYDESVVEVFLDFQRIALHQRIVGRRGIYRTVEEHMPESHRRYHQQQGWTEEDFTSKAAAVGPCTEEAVLRLLSSKAFAQQSFDACLGILRLQKKYGTTRLEAACSVALQVPRLNYRLVNNILENNRDKVSVAAGEQRASLLPLHDNIRGKEVYN
ncbi:IS21 family transposase [Chlorobium phaeobacteroides]|jgi:transposase|uniref:Integrase, catalytic region n=1 Tax=Chlorobium phaeobacteroides (strain DSM 266 / SMG 266 / 2430) TaxID=290317 RepID=A1BHR4_CHLPD|nr:IS21 family transposase [Chlorobium phaeobacteroides]ABL65941.1 Integrase, catalytic region [Chlorobium phaeobacteroides DSM 266]